MDYREVHCPAAEAVLRDCVTLTLNEAMSDRYIEKVARAVVTVTKRLTR
jgi:hypothetical protein